QEQAAELEIANQVLTEEISERKRMELQLAHDALYDGLTGLPNRALFMDRLGHSIEYARRYPDFYFSVLFLDLDHFKVINDSLGHIAGDNLLVGIGKRLTSCIRASDTVARLGGDEFVILLEDTHGDEPATEAIRRIREELSAPFDLQGHEVVTTTSAGIVTRISGSVLPAEILRDADIAMYQAKLSGQDCYVMFNPELRTQAMSRLQLENDMRHGLERQEFVLFYQPIFSLESDRIVGFEALIRWNHPRRGMILPGDFIPVAEESGLILGIGKWVLRQACEQMSLWRRLLPGAEDLTINVNISSKQFSQVHFVEQVEQVLRDTGLTPEALKLEITESVVIDNQAHANALFDRLGKLGVKMQVDDFGTGYSSLSYLQNFPIQGIKIDKSFIQEMGRLGKNPDLVRTILMMARDLGMIAVAEGVETVEQLAVLKDLSCAFGQGFLLARPMDEQMAARLLERGRVLTEMSQAGD
ncbi:MAG: EAL domain-containing protein, partial [Chloroflexi bacterium]